MDLSEIKSPVCQIGMFASTQARSVTVHFP